VGCHAGNHFIVRPKAGYGYLATAAHFAAESPTGTSVNACTSDDFTKSVDALLNLSIGNILGWAILECGKIYDIYFLDWANFEYGKIYDIYFPSSSCASSTARLATSLTCCASLAAAPPPAASS
jgi:hypothetical protein